MQHTAKDFGPFDLRREQRDPAATCRRISRTARFDGVTGRADPQLLARRLVKGNNASR
jgi:hypothetical protein